MSRLLLLGLALSLCLCLALGGVMLDLQSPPSSTAGEPALRHANAARSIEWSRSEAPHAELSLLIHRPQEGALRPKLFPFKDDVTVADVLASSLPVGLVQPRAGDALRCAVMSERKAVDKSLQLAELLQKNALANGDNSLRLECVLRRGDSDDELARRFSFSFHHFLAPQLNPNEIRARNDLRHSATNEMRDYPFESPELVSNNWAGLAGWVNAFIKHHWGPIREYPSYETSPTQTGRWHLNTGAVLKRDASFGAESDSEVRIGIVADWAAGTREADLVAQGMMGNATHSFDPHWTLHVGDIYYVGAPEEIVSNMLGVPPPGVKRGVKWPHGSIGSFAVQGNHEMYSRAWGFFDTLCPTLGVRDPKTGLPSGQHGGVVALENAYWRVILLDTGYGTYAWLPKPENRNNTQPEVVIEWLKNEVRIGDPNDKRGIIILMHHQVESGFEAPHEATPLQIAKLMPPNRTIIFLFGHEHRLAFYKLRSLPDSSVPVHFYGRCIGNSGFPHVVEQLPKRAKEAGLQAYDDRLYEVQTGFFSIKVGFNGFTRMTLNKEFAALKYSTIDIDPASGELSENHTVDLVEELFKADGEGNVNLSSFAILNRNMTIVDA